MMTKVYASMAGNVWKIVVGVGDTVEEEQDVVILESMKMEIPIVSEEAGTVMKINVQEGDFVNEGDVLLEIEQGDIGGSELKLPNFAVIKEVGPRDGLQN